MKTGDLITHRNNVEIKTVGDLKSQPHPNIGETVEWRVLRDGSNHRLHLRHGVSSPIAREK